MSSEEATVARPNRRDDILRAAETVFAAKGYDAATMRTIANEAGVRLPLLVYYFDTKQNLYRAIFEEYQYLNLSRLEQLRRCDLAAEDAIEQVTAAFLSMGSPWRRDERTAKYLSIVLREASDPSAKERGIITDLFDPMGREFIAALEEALPDAPEGFHRWAYLFAVGAYTSTNVGDRERDLAPDGAPTGNRLEFLHRFICSGIRGAYR